MARIRTIKPDFWTDEKLTECSVSARLLFIGTWNFADDNGNLDRSPKQIKARVFPIDNIECEPLLQELIAQGLLTEYSVNDKIYLHIQGFTKHQLINRPSKPVCPIYDESLKINKHSVSAHVKLMTEGKVIEGKVIEVKNIAPQKMLEKMGLTSQLAKDWLAVRKLKKSAPTQTAFDAIKLHAEKNGYTFLQAIQISTENGWAGFDVNWLGSDGNAKSKENLIWRNDDNQIMIKAVKLKIHTQGKNKLEILAAIDSKMRAQKENSAA